MTFLSLASSLNMKYINYLSELSGAESKDRSIPNQMVKNSEVMNFLKSKGYKFIHFSSGAEPTDRNRYADLYFRSKAGNEFQMMLIKTTLLNAVERRFKFFRVSTRNRVLFTFSKLGELHKIKEPIFVFAHIISPHPPFCFGANGEPVPEVKLELHGTVWAQKENYVNQLIFISKKVKVLIDEILSGSEIPPIIILQADHGPGSFFGDPGSAAGEPVGENALNERMTIFNAYYLPSGGDTLLYSSITPVNTFRLIFDFYFGTKYGLVDDRSYYSTYFKPYGFINANINGTN
jgi:hypothetical protein